MSATSVGQIGLDLVLNSKGFHKQMSGITGIAKKAGAALAAAFTVKKIIDFGAQCLELGSDLAEVQNVVDVTFPAMAKQVNSFAQDAAVSFGMSETMAKKFTGTFGAMSKSFGFTEKEAYDMSTTLTGLAGDVASFYNISQDESYTKLKSIFTGETESLKDLGVVMTQSALDAFALAKGYGKATAQMSEQEKVALRYAFVQDKLSAAQGDFMRTSDSWANQTRLLKLQFDSLKASIGQGLIAVLTPVIKWMNVLLSKLNVVAKKFADFMSVITGKKQQSGGGGSGVSQVTQDTEELTGSMGGAADTAQKTAKKIKNAFLGIDEINTLPAAPDEEGLSGGGSSAGGGMGDVEAPEAAEEVQKVNPLLDKVLAKAKELAAIFKGGFKEGLGADFEASLKRQKQHIENIGKNLKDIFTDPQVVGAADTFAKKTAKALGQIAGSVVSIGATISENLLGGIDGYLQHNSCFIKKRIAGILDASGEIAELGGSFAVAFANVMEVFRSDAAKSCTESIIAVFANVGLTAMELGAKLGRDMLGVIVKPFVDNKDAIRNALQGMIEVASGILGTFSTTVRTMCSEVIRMYDEHLKPLFDSIAEGISELTASFLSCYETYLAPVLDYLGTKISDLIANHIGPCVSKVISFIGTVADAVKDIWQVWVKPFFDFLINTIIPILAPIIQTIGAIACDAGGIIMDSIGALFEVASGLINFITGLFTGNWRKAWEGMKQVVSGASSFMKACVNGIISVIESLMNGLICGVNTAIRALNKLSFKVPDWIPNIGGKSFGFNLNEIPKASIPRLAQGGYVEKNTPRLAMIGDNRHYGEIVSPEDKMEAVFLQALDKFFAKFMEASVSRGTPVESGGDIIIPIYIGTEKIDEIIITAEQRKNMRTGGR